MPAQRRFPPPWSVEEVAACFIVRDGNGQAVAYVYYEDEPGRRSTAKLASRAIGDVLLYEICGRSELS